MWENRGEGEMAGNGEGEMGGDENGKCGEVEGKRKWEGGIRGRVGK